MELKKHDFGAEIISILTRGMYRDPRDAIREYIQNAVDAKSNQINVKVRTESVIIQDFGIGMDYELLRRAVRLGVSDKNPANNVGFMGIGIYSAFHLCDRLDIYSKGSKGIPNKLSMNFLKMRTILDEEKDLRLSGVKSSDELTDLQTLLEDCIDLTKDGELSKEIYNTAGTRIELVGIDPAYFSILGVFDELANYLRDVIPLKFDKENFSYAEQIENQIKEICEEHKSTFSLVTLNLEVGGRDETLYRPYKDCDFNPNSKPLEPTIIQIKRHNNFFGVAWGCLNSVRKVVDTKSLRGFILKKQGFSIGTRDSLVKYFPKGHSYYDRTIGEVIITHPGLLPNASRTDLEISEYRTKFFDALKNVAEIFDEKAEQFQEWSKTDDELAKITAELKKLNLKFNKIGDNSDELINLLVDVKYQFDKITKRLKRKSSINPERLQIANQIREQAHELTKSIQDKINNLINNQKSQKESRSKSLEIGRNLTSISLPKPDDKKYESFKEILEELDVPLDEEKFKIIVEIIDERFIQTKSRTRKDYYEILNDLKSEIQQRFESL